MAQTNIGGVLLGDIILGASQSNVISRQVTSTLTLTQIISNMHKVVSQTLTLSQTISTTKIIDRTVTSTYAPSQTIKLIKDETVPQTLTLSQH